MKFLRGILDKQKPMFQKGGKLEKFHYLFEAGETFLFVPNEVTPKKGAQIRDAIDLKRLMMTVVIAMIPCLLYGTLVISIILQLELMEASLIKF